MNKPRIAIICEDVLSGIGLKSLLEEFISFAEIDRYLSLQDAEGDFFHYFISAQYWLGHVEELSQMKRHAIVFGQKKEQAQLDADIHFIATDQPQEELTKSLMILQDHAHHHFSHYPEALSEKLRIEDEKRSALLTNREIEVLKLVALGKSSKEIAEEMHISLYTVNTHRKNIMDKLEAHSATKIVAYAVNHGYIDLSQTKQ